MPLSWRASSFERLHELLVQDTFVRRMLVDQYQSVLMFERDVHATKLEELGNGLRDRRFRIFRFHSGIGFEQSAMTWGLRRQR